jgi:hypothetical protein
MSVKIQFNVGQGDSRKNAPEFLSFEIQVASNPGWCPSFDLLTTEQSNDSKITGRAEACSKLPCPEFKLDNKTRGNLIVLKPLKHLRRVV